MTKNYIISILVLVIFLILLKLLFCFRELNCLNFCSRSSKLNTWSSKLDPRFSKTLRIENRVSSQDCQLTFEQYCKTEWKYHSFKLQSPRRALWSSLGHKYILPLCLCMCKINGIKRSCSSVMNRPLGRSSSWIS